MGRRLRVVGRSVQDGRCGVSLHATRRNRHVEVVQQRKIAMPGIPKLQSSRKEAIERKEVRLKAVSTGVCSQWVVPLLVFCVAGLEKERCTA